MNPLRDLFLLRPDVVFLNHGSFGACPKPVFEVYQNWQRELERQPVEFLGRRYGELLREARGALARFVGTHADNLIFVPNATTGLNLVARSLRLAPGDEVLSTDLEYGAMDRMWRFVCERRDARYVCQPMPLPLEDPAQVVEAVWSGVTPRTRVLFFSHITANTALILPVAELADRARRAGLLTVVDGAHAPGQVPLNLDALGVDFYAGNAHKWMMAPKGSAFLYARPEVQELLDPLVVSWDHISLGTSRFLKENEFQGTRDIAAYLSVPAAIDFMAERAWPAVQAACHRLAARARRELCAVTGRPPLCPESDTWFRQMAAVWLPASCDAEALKTRLYDEFRIEVPVNEHHGDWLLRVSIQGYNTEEDVAALVDALRAVL